MIAQPVVTRLHLEKLLRERGLEPTDLRTRTGVFWRTRNDNLVQVPNAPADGFYPDWMLYDLEEMVGRIDGWGRGFGED